jgi:dipeptidyl aminopeptidase/acylaminoacyl peptidase
VLYEGKGLIVTKPHKLVALLIMVSVLQLLTIAQDYSAGPGFDATPLKIEPIVKSAPRPITSLDLLTIRDVTGLQISPDGKSVAYVVSQAIYETNSYRTALFVVDTDPGSLPINLGSAGPPHWTPVGEYLRLSPQWTPDGRHITYLVKEGDRRQIWQWDRAGGRPEQLTHNANDVESYKWQPDGKRIIFTTVARISPDEIKKVSEQGILYDSHAAESYQGSIRVWEGKSIAQAAISARPRKKQIWVYDVTTRHERLATAEEIREYNNAHSAFHYLARKSPDGKNIAYVSNINDPKKSPYISYAVYNKQIDSNDHIELTPPSTEFITDLWWSKGGAEIYFARANRETGTSLYTVPARGGATREIMKSKDLLLNCSVDQDASRAACLRENSMAPAEVVVFNLKEGTPRVLANVNPEFRNIVLSQATKLEWTNEYGDKTFGYLVKPLNYESGKRYPLIVTTYRAYGFLRGAVGDEYPIQVFAANGFAVLAFDASPERVPEIGDYKTGMLRWYSPMASLETVVKLLDGMGIIDPNRKGLTGLSFGAQIANFTISHSDLFQAVATSSISSVDPIFYYLTNKYAHQIYKRYGLHELPDGKAAARWKEISSALNAEKVKAPLLVQVADSEYLYGLQFYTTLRELEKPVEMIIFANEGHIKNQPKHRYEIYQRNLDWFNFWLQVKEDLAPEKHEQYVRWRSMREALKRNRSASMSVH